MRTTLRIDDELLREAKRRAIDRGTTLTQIVEDALRAELARRPPERSERRTLTTFHGGGVNPDIDFSDNAAVRDLMDGL